MENGTGKRRLGAGGGLIYIQDHTDTDAAPQAKLKFREIPPKTNQEDWQRGKRHSPLILATMGHRLHVLICASICRNVEIKHKHTPCSLGVGGMCKCGT